MINQPLLHPYGHKNLWGLTLTILKGGGGGKNGPAHFFPTLETKEIAKYSILVCVITPVKH